MDLARYCCEIHFEGDFGRAVREIADVLNGRVLRARRAAIDAALELLMINEGFYKVIESNQKTLVCWVAGLGSYVLCV